MPNRIEPALALLSDRVPTGPEWEYEVKWDGYRLAVHLELNGIRIITRGGHDWTARFATISSSARDFRPRTMILDGEAVVLDQHGRSDFGALQKALGGRGGKRTANEAIFYALDLLYLDGHDLTRMDQRERREMLHDLLDSYDGAIKFSESVKADGDQLLASACELGLEGIIAKHGERPYRPGRTGDWVKVNASRAIHSSSSASNPPPPFPERSRARCWRRKTETRTRMSVRWAQASNTPRRVR